jgi:putative redox protein
VVRVDIAYRGELRCEARHAPSGAVVITDAPADNHGKGESFSPTDLVATALGSCMLTIMGIVAARHSIDLRGTTVTVEKHMVADPVRRIGRLPVRIEVKTPVTAEQKKLLETAALTCPVHKSLHPDIDKPVEFVFPAN